MQIFSRAFGPTVQKVGIQHRINSLDIEKSSTKNNTFQDNPIVKNSFFGIWTIISVFSEFIATKILVPSE